MNRVETIGRATLYLGDCRDILPTLPKVDAVVTDPPYGLGGRLANDNANGEWGLCSKESLAWDKRTQPDEVGLAIDLCDDAIVWGGNYYALPIARCWLLWDKMQEHSGAHAEMAWTNLDRPVRTFRMARAAAFGVRPNGELNGDLKVHPTQKPEPLMRWCIGFLPDAQTILDPFMGSGTTGVAAVQMGRDFIGIEREPKYFDIACKRIEDAQRQKDLFIDGEAA